MKKLVCIIMMIILILTTLPASASNERISGLFTYEIKGNGTAIITDFDWESNFGQDVYIPNMIDGYIVTTIGQNAFSTDSTEGFNSVVVTMPDTVTTLEERAFFLAPVSAINITQKLRTIGSGALTTREGVQFNLAPNHQWFAIIDNALYEKSTKKLIAISGTEHFLNIPEGIKTIGAYACYNGRRSEDGSMGVYIPRSVSTIEEYAFANTFSLNGEYDSGYGLEGLKSLGEGCFQGILFHDEFVLPDGITEIPAHAFESSTASEAFILPESIEKIGAYAFHAFSLYGTWGSSSGLSEELLAELEVYGYSSEDVEAIAADGNLEMFLMELGMEYDGSDSSNPAILPSNIKEIGEYCFYTSEGIFKEGTVVIPSAAETIGSNAFAKCGVTNCTLPFSVTEISHDAFDRERVTLKVEQNSYAEAFAQEWGYNYQYNNAVEDDLSWLYN